MPGAAYVEREYVFALQRARMAGAALTHATRRPELYTEAQMRRLQADALAEQVRLASMPTRNEADRFAIADRVLARYDTLIPAWSTQGDETRDDVIRARIDRLHALHARYRMRDLASEYEALRAEGVAVPRYALGDVASAYLYLRQPEQAAAIYQQVAQAEKATTTIRWTGWATRPAATTRWPRQRISTAPRRSWTRPARAIRPGSTSRASPCASPTTCTCRACRSTPARGCRPTIRQRPRRAWKAWRATPQQLHAQERTGRAVSRPLAARASERTLKMAETLTPRNIGVENGQGFTALALQEWRQAEALSRDTLARAPENLLSRRLAREWAVHNKAELRIGGYRGLASDSPVSGSGDFGIDAVIYTPPLDYNWRGFAGGGYANGDFEEGRGTYRWARAGAQWRGRDLTVEGEVSANQYGHGARTGLRLSAAYDLDDHWQIGGSAERLSRDTPRALASGVSSNGLSAYARWRARAQRMDAAALALALFRRQPALGAGPGRPRADPHHAAPEDRPDAGTVLATQQPGRGTPLLQPALGPDGPARPAADAHAAPPLRKRLGTDRHAGRRRVYAAGLRHWRRDRAGLWSALPRQRRARHGRHGDRHQPAYDGRRERELRITFDLAYRF